MVKRILQYFRRETVLSAALVCALLSFLLTPPSVIHLQGIDTTTLLMLFSLMTIVAGFRRMGALDAVSRKLTRRVTTLRGLSAVMVARCFVLSMLLTNDVALLTLVPLTLLLFLGIIFAIFFILIPRLEEAGTTMVANIPTYVNQIQVWWTNLSDFAAEHGVTLPELSLSADQVKDTITGFLQEKGDSVVNTTLNITTSILSALVNFLLALVFSLYLLAQKETLLAQSRRLLRRILPQKAADRLMRLLSLTNNAFSSFVTGQVTEAFILGTLCCIGMLILRLPYALPVSVIIASLSLIPIFGAWIGAATGAFLIVFQSPIKALTFLIFLLILQQVEGNLIYPKVVGKSVGLPGLWVLAAVTIGGGAFGVLGMLLGVPVCSVVYVLVQDYIRSGKPARTDGVPPTQS